MAGKKVSVKDKVRPDLLLPPHIVDTLIRLVLGEWQPAPSQQEQLVVHLTECTYCRTALIVLLSADQEYEIFSQRYKLSNSKSEYDHKMLLLILAKFALRSML
jgi:hypothetical protein